MAYSPKSKPFPHQAKWLTETVARPYWGLWWEQGTGKTKLGLDTAGELESAGEIRGLFLLAPNGVHRNWISDEIPKHLSDELAERSKFLIWRTAAAATKSFGQEAASILSYPGFVVVAMSYDAIMTDAGASFAKALLSKRRCLYVADESSFIKTPRAKRTMRVLASAKYAPFRRVMNGTPIDNSPFDVYTQARFLKDDVWHPIGCATFSAFKTMFGVWREGWNGQQGQRFAQLVGYRNLSVLKEVIDSIGCRVTKEEVFDLPPKLYTKRYFDLGPKARKVYDSVRDDFIAELAGGEVTAALAIVRLTRLQQIASGFVPVATEDPDAEPVVDLETPNPRIQLLREVVEGTPGKAIVWAKYDRDIDAILAAMREDKVEAVRYDGRVDDLGRAAALESFKRGSAKLFVSKTRVGGTGLTLTEATTMIYYNNTFRLGDRLQSEDRAHRHGQEHPVTYFDMIASDTVDEKLVDNLRMKKTMATFLTGDTVKEWL